MALKIQAGAAAVVELALDSIRYRRKSVAHDDSKSGMKADFVIENGMVVDGTGCPAYLANVAVRGNRIIAVGDTTHVQSGSRLDAEGSMVSPGFIDAHTHDDRVLLSSPDMTSKISQGVTTVVTGNCGISLAPIAGKNPVPPMNLLGDRNWYRFESVADYAAMLDAEPAAVNSVMLVGHTTLRVATMNRVDRAATRDEALSMERMVDSAMQDGCIGLSSGLEYPPAKAAPPDEVLQLAKRASSANGIYATHMRDEADQVCDSIRETVDVAEHASIRTIISHHKTCGKKNWGRTAETLPLISAAQKRVDINIDVYPYTASSTSLLKQYLPKADRVVVTWSEPYPEFSGADLSDIVECWGVSRSEAVDRLSPAGAIYFQMDENDLRRVLKFNGSMIGSDGLSSDRFPHPRLWGTFPRVLGRYARELDLFPIEVAVAKMTGITARTFGLQCRGLIQPDMFADIVIFDFESVADRADFKNPIQSAAGIECVMVNGEIVYTREGWTGKRPGRLLKGG